MHNDKKPVDKITRLRQRAEERLQGGQKGEPPWDEPEILRLLHELEVHQIELELQNTELRRAQEETEQLLEQYTDLYDFAPVGYFTFEPDGTVRACNLVGAALLGRERSRLLGCSFLPFVCSGDRSAFTGLLAKVMAGGRKEELELRIAPQPDGSPTLFVKIEAVADPTGSSCRAALIDITRPRQIEEELKKYREHLEWLVGERTLSLEAQISERGRAEQEVKALNACLEKRVAERTGELQSTIRDLQTFSYSISHDLRTPLRSMNSFANVLLEDYGAQLNEEGKRLLNSIVQRTVNMGTLIDDLLSFSRNSRLQLAVAPIDMTALVKELVEKLSGEGEASGVEFRIAALPRASGDRAMIAQVLENLLANAVKFSRKTERPVVTVGSLPGEQELVYFVKDNGIGFDMKYIDAIFGVFQRLHHAEDYEGTGVGLAIVEQIVTKHGGRVWAEGHPGEGAIFYFSLPKHSPGED
jgi:signal transduction histidine kinase